MTFSPDKFDQQISLLTRPEFGVVAATAHPDLFAITQNQPQLDTGKPLAVLTGPSRAGKDSIAASLLAVEPRLVRVRTATTRSRRDDEAADAKTWLRARGDQETHDAWHEALITEYDLVESSAHNGEIYGLPRQNLDTIPDGRVPLIDTDTSGIRSLRGTLAGEYALVSVMICPENASQLQTRMAALGHNGQLRLEAAQKYIDDAPNVANYALLNRSGADPEAAIFRSSEQIRLALGELGCFGETSYDFTQ